MPQERYYILSTKYSLQERQTKRGRVYDVVFRIITHEGDEKQKKLSGFSTKALAKQAYVDFVTSKCELVKNNPMKKKDPSKKEPTVRELLQEYIASLSNQNKDSTIYSKQGTYRAYIIPPLGDIPVKDLTKECLYKWQDYLWQTKNPRTGEYYSYKYLANIRELLYVFLEWCDSRYGYPNNMRRVQKPKRRVQKTKMQIWTREQFEKFISVVNDPMYHALFTMLFFTGRRKGELFALTQEDIKETAIVFDKSLTRKVLDKSKTYEITSTKAEKDAIIPICKTVQNELQQYPGESPFFFGGERPLAENTVTRRFDEFCKKADVPRIRIHDLRHSFVSMLIHMGTNYNVIADLISDTVEQVIKTYGHLYESDKQKVVDEIG